MAPDAARRGVGLSKDGSDLCLVLVVKHHMRQRLVLLQVLPVPNTCTTHHTSHIHATQSVIRTFTKPEALGVSCSSLSFSLSLFLSLSLSLSLDTEDDPTGVWCELSEDPCGCDIGDGGLVLVRHLPSYMLYLLTHLLADKHKT